MRQKLPLSLLIFSLIFAGSQVTAKASPSEWVVPWGVNDKCSVGSYDINYTHHATMKGGTAVDFLNSNNIMLYAPTDGTIVTLQDDYAPIGYAGCKDGRGGYGNHIEIYTDDGYRIIMAHFHDIDPDLSERFALGENRISRGEYLGHMGTSGNSTGIHLHFEIITSKDVFSTVFGLGSSSLVKATLIPGGISTSDPASTQETSSSIAVLKAYMADDKNGSGVNYTFGYGDYRDPNCFGDLGNDMISHIQVPFGLGVTVYDNDNFSGEYRTFNEGTYNLEDSGWSNRISSFVVHDVNNPPAQPTPQPTLQPILSSSKVYMADDKHGSGVNYTFAIGNYQDPGNFGDLGNDMISHIQVPFGLGVTVYDNDNYSGEYRTFNKGTYNLEDSGWSNRISSFVVHDVNNPPAQPTPQPTLQPILSSSKVYMADDKHGSGVNYTFAIGNYQDPGSFGDLGNDEISYIQVPSGLGVTVYENDGYGGDSQTFNEGSYNLDGSGWNNRISSFVVYDSYNAAEHPDDYQRAYDQAYADAYAEEYPYAFAQGYGDVDLASGGFDPDHYEQEHSGDPTPVPTEANPSPAYQQGYLQGLTDGNEDGYAQGYTDGYVSADPVSEEEPASDDQTTMPSGISLVTGNELENASQLVNMFSLMRSDFDLRQEFPDEDTLRNILLSPLLLQSMNQSVEYTGNDPQWIGYSYFPYETFCMGVVEYLDADPDDFTLLLDEERFYYPNLGCTQSQVTLQKIEPIGDGYYQADGVLEGESGDDGSYTPLGYLYQAILRLKPDATYRFVIVAQHTSATASRAAANTGASNTASSVAVEWLDCCTVDDQIVTVPAIGSVSYNGSIWAYVTGTILEDVPTILNRPKRDLWVEVYTRDGEPATELALTPCRSQTEFDELLEDIAQDGATNGTLCYAQSIPYIQFTGQRNTACVLMVIQDIAYYYTFFSPTDELLANWVQAHTAFGLPLNQIEQYALGANVPAANQTITTASQSETQTAIPTNDWKQLYLDYLQTHLTFDENDDFYIQILALQDYDLDGIPEMLLGIPYGDTSSANFRGRLYTVKNGELALYRTADGNDSFNFANQLLNAKLSKDLEDQQMSWVYQMPYIEFTAAFAIESCGNFILDREALLIENTTAYSLMSSSGEEEIRSVPEVSSIDEWYALRDAFLAKFNTVSDQSCNRYQIRNEDASMYFSGSESLWTDIIMEAFDAWQPSASTMEDTVTSNTNQTLTTPRNPVSHSKSICICSKGSKFQRHHL